MSLLSFFGKYSFQKIKWKNESENRQGEPENQEGNHSDDSDQYPDPHKWGVLRISSRSWIGLSWFLNSKLDDKLKASCHAELQALNLEDLGIPIVCGGEVEGNIRCGSNWFDRIRKSENLKRFIK